MISVDGKQILGQRDTQEDAFRIIRQSEEDPNADILMLLADGMGGHAGGEVASNLALEVFEKHFTSVSQNPKPRQRLREALLAANEAVGRRVKEDRALAGMGCTVLAVLKIGDRLLWASVGDSPLFLYRDGKLNRLNADHSLYGELLEMVEAGKISQAEADAHPKRNALRSAVMGDPLKLIDVNWAELRPGDLVVLATDGVETLQDAQIVSILASDARADVRAIASDLLNGVEDVAKPNQDNTTVVVYRHEREGMSGFYRDSRWRLSGKPRYSGQNLAMAAAGLVAVAALILMVWVIGFGGDQPQEPDVVETPAATVDRSEGVIGGGDASPSDGGDDMGGDGGILESDPEGQAAPDVEDEGGDDSEAPVPPEGEGDSGEVPEAPQTDEADGLQDDSGGVAGPDAGDQAPGAEPDDSSFDDQSSQGQ